MHLSPSSKLGYLSFNGCIKPILTNIIYLLINYDHEHEKQLAPHDQSLFIDSISTYPLMSLGYWIILLGGNLITQDFVCTVSDTWNICLSVVLSPSMSLIRK